MRLRMRSDWFEISNRCKNLFCLDEHLTTVLDKIFVDLFMFNYIFVSLQVKQNQIIITRKWMYELHHKFLNNISLRT